MSTIRNAIVQSAQANGLGHYLSEAEPIIADLERQVDSVVGALSELAHQKGLSESETEEALIQVGLVERPAPEPEFTVTATDGSLTTDDRLSSLESRVDHLVALAERHLGSRI